MCGTVWRAALIVLSLLAQGGAEADERTFITGGTARVRALGMGGAYASLEDDLGAGLYNPAAFRVNATRSERPWRLFFNPAGSIAAFNDYSRYDLDYLEDNGITETEALRAASLLVKGLVFAAPSVDAGLIFNEPVLRDNSSGVLRERFFSAEGLTREAFHTAVVNVKIAPAVSIGLSGSLYRIREDGRDEYRTGHTFGVRLDPTPKMKIGVTYIQLPEEAADTRLELERLGSGTITGGVSYYPDSKTVLSVDIRNMNREDYPASREIHAGFERVLGSRLALRGGYYRTKETERDVYSVGVGILPVWDKITRYQYSTRNDLLSYSFVMEEGNPARRWHVLSLLLRY